MSHFIHKLINKDGQCVQLPAYVRGQDEYYNLATPNPFDQTAAQQYPYGTRFADGECVYRYMKAGNDIVRALNGVFSFATALETAVNTYGASVAGATTIYVDGATAGSPAKDAWAGGYITVLGSSQTYRHVNRIVSNKAADSTSPYAVELTLAHAEPFALADDCNCEIYPNRYSDVRTEYATGGGTTRVCVGWVARPMTSGYFGWVKTWGPQFCVRAAELLDTNGDRDIVVAGDGAVRACAYIINGGSSGVSYQRVGYAMGVNNNSGTIELPGWCFIQIDP